MKQIAKTPEVLAALKASFGPDADLTNLAVYETGLLNTQPLRKTSGLFQGARTSLSLLSEMATAVNTESVPLRAEHLDDALPFGRVFTGKVTSGDELRGLFAVNKVTHPQLVSDLDAGTIDQVSVGMANKRITCSACGFDYLGPEASIVNLYEATCNEGHTVGEDGVFVHLDGLKSWFETSLVGKGAAQGARIVGPSDSVFQNSDALQQLAASAKDRGIAGLRLSASPLPSQSTHQEEPQSVDKEVLAQITAAITDKTVAEGKVAGLEGQVTALTARVSELEPVAARATAAETQLTAAQADVTAAIEVLTEEAKTILTALRKPVDNLPKTVTELKATIAEHRAAFAAMIPTDGVSRSSDNQPEVKASASLTAFRAPK